MNIAFFDFDGTMARGDSLLAFVAFACGRRRLYWGLFSRGFILLGYMLGLISNSSAKQKLTRYFFAGIRQDNFLQICEEFCPILERRLKPAALERLQWHKNRGDRVVMVSASFLEYLAPLCAKLEMDCIATSLEVLEARDSREAVLSGWFATENCYGEQKAVRIRAKYNLSDYDAIYAYGDSKGDIAMLSLATQAFYKPF